MPKVKFSEIDFDKATAALIKVRAKKKTPVMQWIEQHLDKIDSLQKDGASLRNIFLSVNESVNFGISYASFQRYVLTARKAAGSDLYTPKPHKPPETPVQQAVSEKDPTPTPTEEQEWACPDCESKSTRKVKGNLAGWRCPSCLTSYYDDDGKLTSRRLP